MAVDSTRVASPIASITAASLNSSNIGSTVIASTDEFGGCTAQRRHTGLNGDIAT
jgi:hypothetical protein